jgi:hypothetical protein
MRLSYTNQPNHKNTLISIFLLFLIFISSSTLLSMYPQHLYIDNLTRIATTSFPSPNNVSISGHQQSYSSGDTIFLQGQEYIRITGNQRPIGTLLLTPAIRTISASFLNNPLFERNIGSFSVNSASLLTIDNVSLSLIPISQTILKVQTSDSNYNVEFVSPTTYITSNNILLKLSLNPDRSIFI